LANLARPNLGYEEAAFLGYPARQYLPLAVPPRLAGRTVTALRLGAAILVLLGLAVFAAGVRAPDDTESSAHTAGLALLALFTFPYVAVQLPFYDQTILPFAFVCHAVGWLALAQARFTIPRFLAALWAIAMLGTGYTPGLAPWLLFLLLLSILAARRWKEHRAEAIAWASGAFWCAGIGACSFLARIDLQVAKDDSPFLADSPLRAKKTLGILLFGDPVAFLSPLLMLPILLWFFFALIGRGGIVDFLVAAWAVGVIFVATQLRGYTVPSVEFALHRAIVVVPLLVAGLAARARGLLGDAAWKRGWVWPAAVLLAGYSALIFSQQWKTTIGFSAREPFVADVQRERAARGWRPDQRFTLGLLMESNDLDNAENLTGYFFPTARVVRTESALESAIRETREYIVYADRSRGLPETVKGIDESRVEIELRGPGWSYPMVRASGSATEAWLGSRGALPPLDESSIPLGGRTVRVRYSPADMGQIQDVFDGDWLTLLRTRASTTAIVDVLFDGPRTLKGVSVWTASMNVGLRVLLYRQVESDTEKPSSYERIWPEAPPDPDVALLFPAPEREVRRVRVEIANLQGGDGHIHIREVRLLE
jgi:hypothetical protein